MDEDTVEEIKRHFGLVAEELRGDVRLVADAVDMLQERVDERFEQVGVEFREVKSMIRLSYAEIDRRFQLSRPM